MKIDGIIASLPTMDTAKRKIVRGRASQWAISGSDDQKIAGQKMLDAIGVLEGDEQAARSAHVEGLPVVQRLVEAFTVPAMTDKEITVVRVLLEHPGLTSRELSQKAGWRGQSWHLHFGTMCSDRRGRLWAGPLSESRGKEFYTGIVADYDEAAHTFKMKPEAIEAFAAIGLQT